MFVKHIFSLNNRYINTRNIFSKIKKLQTINYITFPRISSSNDSKVSVFIVGCQRSGTRMLLNVIERCKQECQIYRESNQVAMSRYRLRDKNTIQGLIDGSRKRIIVFKPLNDSQHTDRLLEYSSNAKAVWIYRQYDDVINSSLNKWSTSWKDIVCGISKDSAYNESERMSPDAKALIKKFCSQDMSSEDGAALLWYVRNLIFFDLELQNDHRVLLVNYEDLVIEPQRYFRRIFDFIGCHFSYKYIKDVSAASIKKSPPPSIHPEIKSLCNEMIQRLNEQYVMQLG